MAGKKRTAAEKQKITKRAQKAFKEWNEQREDKTVEFRQCEDIKYWYIADSDEDIVISFYDSKEPVYLTILETQKGYRFVSGGGKPYYIHRLKAEAFPDKVYRYGNVKVKYKSIKNKEVHHKNEVVSDNSFSNLEVLPIPVHHLFDSAPAPSASDDEHIEYMKKVARRVEENTPDQTVILFDGNGFVNGKEVRNLPKVIFADDAEGITELAQQALEAYYEQLRKSIKIVAVSAEDEERLKKLEPKEREELNKMVLFTYQRAEKTPYLFNYCGIALWVW